MTKNQEYLEKAKSRIKDFEKELEPEYLREASLALVNVNLNSEIELVIREAVRKATLYQWLELLATLDKHIDPKFNPDEEVPLRISPPEGAHLEGSKEQAEFRKAVAENDKKLKNQSLQILLQRENEQIQKKAESFIRKSYSSSPVDEAELRAAIDKVIENPKRKAELLKIFEH